METAACTSDNPRLPPFTPPASRYNPASCPTIGYWGSPSDRRLTQDSSASETRPSALKIPTLRNHHHLDNLCSLDGRVVEQTTLERPLLHRRQASSRQVRKRSASSSSRKIWRDDLRNRISTETFPSLAHG